MRKLLTAICLAVALSAGSMAHGNPGDQQGVGIIPLDKRVVEMVAAEVSSYLPSNVEGTHVVTGWAQLEADRWLGIAAQTVREGGVPGRAWLSSTGSAQRQVEITLDCLEVTWWMPVYPIPPYLPYHSVEASGIGSDGALYWITAYDVILRRLRARGVATIPRPESRSGSLAEAQAENELNLLMRQGSLSRDPSIEHELRKLIGVRPHKL